MAAAQAGDSGAYARLLRDILPYVRAIVRRHHTAPDRMEDVVQDVLLTIQELAGEANYAKMKAAVMQVVTEHFRPEFLNRVDEIVVFHPLAREQIRAIVEIQLGRLRQRLAERDIQLRLEDDARDKIGEAGFDTVYGARPLKRAIQAQIENPLAQQILRGDFVAGDRVVAKLRRSELVFEKERLH